MAWNESWRIPFDKFPYRFNLGSPSYIESAMMRPASMGWGTIKFRTRISSTFEDANRGARTDIKLEF